jgi:hypothetical protein
MKCPDCKKELVDVMVSVEGAENKALSHQCKSCGYFEFEKKSSNAVIKELKRKETALKIRQKVIKLSKGRLGLYFSKDVINSLDIKAGEEVDITVPDKKRIVIHLL